MSVRPQGQVDRIANVRPEGPVSRIVNVSVICAATHSLLFKTAVLLAAERSGSASRL